MYASPSTLQLALSRALRKTPQFPLRHCSLDEIVMTLETDKKKLEFPLEKGVKAISFRYDQWGMSKGFREFMNRDIPRIKYANPRVTIHTWQFTKEPYPRDSIDASNDPQAGLLKVSKRAKEMKKKREKERQAQLEEEALARSEALSEAMKRLGQSPPQATTREARATTGQSSSSSSSSDPISSTLTSSTSSSSSSNNSPTAPSTPSSASSASPSTSTSDTSSDPSSSSSSSASASSSSSSSSSSPSSSTTTTTTTTSTTSPSASSSMLNRTQTVKSPKEYTGIRPDPLELDNGAWRQRFRAAKERQELEPTEIVIEYDARPPRTIKFAGEDGHELVQQILDIVHDKHVLVEGQ